MNRMSGMFLAEHKKEKKEKILITTLTIFFSRVCSFLHSPENEIMIYEKYV